MAGSCERGDLVFDIGAHVGDRIAAFRRLGARVVAVEPQPALVKTLKLLYGRDRAVAIEPVAVGRNGERSSSSSTSTIRRCRRLRRPSCGQPTARRAGRDKRGPGRSAFRLPRSTRSLRGMECRPSSRSTSKDFEAEALAGLTRPLARAVVRIHHDPARAWRPPASSVAPRSAMRATTRCSARARRWSFPIG